jgi:hypothetical protein
MTGNIHDVRFTAADPAQLVEGLLGHVRFEVGALRIDRVMVRRSREGRTCLSFPVHRARSGIEFPIVRPTTPWERARIESAVIGELRRRGEIP